MFISQGPRVHTADPDLRGRISPAALGGRAAPSSLGSAGRYSLSLECSIEGERRQWITHLLTSTHRALAGPPWVRVRTPHGPGRGEAVMLRTCRSEASGSLRTCCMPSTCPGQRGQMAATRQRPCSPGSDPPAESRVCCGTESISGALSHSSLDQAEPRGPGGWDTSRLTLNHVVFPSRDVAGHVFREAIPRCDRHRQRLDGAGGDCAPVFHVGTLKTPGPLATLCVS